MLTIDCASCADKIPKRYDDGNCEILRRPYGFDKMIGFHCSVSFTDILDTAAAGEWETLLQGTDVIISPFAGDFEMGDSTTETFEVGDGTEISDFIETPWTFRTMSVAADFSDEEFWYAWHNQFAYYSWGFIDMNSRLYLEENLIADIKASLGGGATPVPTSQPGFRFSLQTPPQWKQVNGKGKSGKWECSGIFKHQYVIRSVEIPGLNELFQANG